MNLHKRLGIAAGMVASLVLAASWVNAARAQEPIEFHVGGHLRLPAPSPMTSIICMSRRLTRSGFSPSRIPTM